MIFSHCQIQVCRRYDGSTEAHARNALREGCLEEDQCSPGVKKSCYTAHRKNIDLGSFLKEDLIAQVTVQDTWIGVSWRKPNMLQRMDMDFSEVLQQQLWIWSWCRMMIKLKI